MPEVPNSILDTTKKILQVDPDYTVFDIDIITHINSVFFTLQQLGLGPTNGFMIEDNAKLWSEYTLGDNALNAVKTYMYMRVRLMFDPPATSFAIEALIKQVLEMEWRLNVHREGEEHP